MAQTLGDAVATSSPPTDVTPTSVTQPNSPTVELALSAGMAAASGVTIGGIASGTWRGAGIGAGVSMGLWGVMTVQQGWTRLSREEKTIVAGSSAVGVVSAIALVLTRK
jgi:hypothetical protein